MTDADYAARARTATTWASPVERALVPIYECNEPLVSLNDSCPAVRVEIRVKARREFIGGDLLWARRQVASMLSSLADLVAPLKIVVFDAHRPVSYQTARYNQVYAEKKKAYPDLTPEELAVATDAQVALPSESPTSPPPHSTGGAIDMLLTDSEGYPLDFGSTPGIYNVTREDARHPTNADGLAPTHVENRRRLLDAAVACGFANFPGEWWHYSFGDQEWALYTARSDHAIYGRVENDVRN